MALGRTQLAIGDKSSARSTFQAATRLAEFDAGTQIVIGRLQLAAGNPDGASYNVQKALLGRPDDPVAMALVVEIEARRGDSAKADAALKALTAKHPNRVETAVATADLAMSRGQYAAAVAAYRTALSRDETTANALNLVRAHIAAGEAGKAATFLDGWVKSRPNDLPASKALAEAQFRAGQLAAARQSYARVVAAAPDDATTLNNYANLLLQLNDPAAQEQAEKALKLVPNNPDFADTLGWILVQKGADRRRFALPARRAPAWARKMARCAFTWRTRLPRPVVPPRPARNSPPRSKAAAGGKQCGGQRN